MRNETSTIYENGQNNEYNYRSEINASINVNHLNQQKTLNSQLERADYAMSLDSANLTFGTRLISNDPG